MIDKDNLNIICDRVMAQLKDFQRATVERVIQLFCSATNRVLVSDEVGLGKTLVARGVVAKFAQSFAKDDEVIKVVYICSNGAIAGQNLDKLRIDGKKDGYDTSSTRLSMQHLHTFQQENNQKANNSPIQLIAITPDTSFNMTNGQGIVPERALINVILDKYFENCQSQLCQYKTQLDELLRNGVDEGSWKWWKYEHYTKEVEKCDKDSKNNYLNFMYEKLQQEFDKKQEYDKKQKYDKKIDDSNKEGPKYFDKLKNVLQNMQNGEDCSWLRKDILKDLRRIFARVSIEKLKPQLVIMDEFQRFKDLLNCQEDSETDMLKKQFFDNKDAKILLLSATPYKMYATLEEVDVDNPNEYYKEFLDVLKFLNITDEKQKEFEEIWHDYSSQLKEFALGNSAVLQIKQNAEDALYSHICRTERIMAENSKDIIDVSDSSKNVNLSAEDVKSYIQLQSLMNGTIGGNAPIDYVKSCPYLMSFMRNYKLKKKIEEYFAKNPEEFGKIKWKNLNNLFVKQDNWSRYEKIPSNNARLESVTSLILDKDPQLKQDPQLLLWLPPTKPYYEPKDPFAGVKNATKTLIFSSWEMVPRMLASLISYEVERNTIAQLAIKEGKKINYFVNDLKEDDNEYADEDAREDGKKTKRYPIAKLNFRIDNGSMYLFCLMYPSKVLADIYEPIKYMEKSPEEIKEQLKDKITQRLYDIKEIVAIDENKAEDRAWYYVAPLLLDKQDDEEYCKKYFDDVFKSIENIKGESYFKSHCEEYKKIFDGQLDVLGKMPNDLADMLLDMAIASPAVCAYRAYKNYFEEFDYSYPTQLARGFVSNINKPESTAVIELCFGCKGKGEDEEYVFWQKVLKYCLAGNFQAMLDEYAHLLTNGISKEELDCGRINGEILSALAFRTTSYDVDTREYFEYRLKKQDTQKKKGLRGSKKMRSHYAAAFVKGENNEKGYDRKIAIRSAFNSPFRPFVLASTSIGQEGLDFHNYCRRIVHWNLPSNPIDLEQREGRINRYECLAIRQNVAKRYGNLPFDNDKDIWSEMFGRAEKNERKDCTSDLVPHWVIMPSEDMIKIERVVPMYPLSRDESAYERIIKIMNLYRMTIGQPNQEELMEYVINKYDDYDDVKDWTINLSPYFKDTNVEKDKTDKDS